MAEGYQTEEEQIESLKKWWAENGKSTLATIVVAIAAVFGWEAYKNQQQASMEAASALYQNLLTAVSGAQNDEQKQATAKHLADTLKQDYAKSTYAQFAAFYKAQSAVASDDLDTAEQELRWALERAKLPEVAIQARLRLARVLFAKEQYEEALQQLEGDSAAYAASFAEVRGDILQAQGKNKLALAAYEQAVEQNQQSREPVNNGLLLIKLEQLKSALGDSASEGA